MRTPDTQLELFPDPAPDPLPPHVYPMPLGAIGHCRSCGAEIIWATTPSGAHVPLSYATRRELAGQWVATSHYRDCPQASSWGGRHGGS